MDQADRRFQWIGDLFQSVEPVYLWCFDGQGCAIATNCPDEQIPNAVFDLIGWRQDMVRHFKDSDAPYIMGSPFGILWICVADKTLPPEARIYVLGPVTASTISRRQFQQGLDSCKLTYKGDRPLAELIQSLDHAPVISPNMIQRYTTLLHFAVNSEKISVSAIRFNATTVPANAPKGQKSKDRHKNYHAEQALLCAVRNGDINYANLLSAAQSVGTGIAVTSSDPLRSYKNTLIIFATLCARAAIEGGLSPDEAYTVSDRYIQEGENCRNIAELTACNHSMLDDLIQRVRQKRKNPRLSAQIQNCCDYIELHCEDKLRIKDLAHNAGYTEYYLSKRFKQETGLTINDYIKFTKIERAKMLLCTTDLNISDIADQLCFSSRGYFGEVFAQVVGMTPTKYRKENKFR